MKMAVDSPNFIIKVVWTAHFVLSSWGMMSGFIPVNTYWYTHLGLLAFGFWAIVDKKSIDAIIMFLVCLVVSVLNDMLCIAIYQPRADAAIERPGMPQSAKDTYRWGLGMAITNLLIKPISIFLIYRVYETRAKGAEFNYKLPAGIPGLNTGRSRTAYADIDEPAESNPTPTYQPPPLASYHDSPTTQKVDSQDHSEA